MKELNDFRKFLNEDLDEGVMDKLKKFGKKVKDVADKMDGGDDHGGIFHNVPGGKPTPRNQKEELKKTQEGELHEGTWSLGSTRQMKDEISTLEALVQKAYEADDPKKRGRGFTDGFKQYMNNENINSRLYRVFGDDSFHDAWDNAKTQANTNRFDAAANSLIDALGRAKELLKGQEEYEKDRFEEGEVEEGMVGDLMKKIRDKRAAKKEKERFTKGLDMKRGGAPEIDPEFTKGLEENDAVLDEVIEETVFDDIDNNMKLIAVHMDAAEALEAIVAEFQAISGGTKMVDKVLKSIVQDYNLTGDAEEYASIGFEE